MTQLKLFTFCFRQFNEFTSFWSKIAELYNSDKKSRIKIASVNCNDNQKLCRNEGISELLQLKFFAIDGDDFEWQPIAEFINRTIHDTLENFRMQVATRNKLQDGKHFVKFFVPYCGHCKNMAPVWDELEDFFVKDTNVSLLSVDCTKSRSICDQYEVFRYPTMLWIEDGSVVEKYSGTRSFKYFKDYIENMLENSQPTAVATSSKKVEEESGILDLNSNDFNEVIAKDFTFVKFYMPRCSHCKEINKLWNVLARKFASSETIKIAQVNCVHNYDLCMEEAKGCPTLNVYGNGKLLVKDYYEDTTLEGLSDCIISNQKGGKGEKFYKFIWVFETTRGMPKNVCFYSNLIF